MSEDFRSKFVEDVTNHFKALCSNLDALADIDGRRDLTTSAGWDVCHWIRCLKFLYAARNSIPSPIRSLETAQRGFDLSIADEWKHAKHAVRKLDGFLTRLRAHNQPGDRRDQEVLGKAISGIDEGLELLRPFVDSVVVDSSLFETIANYSAQVGIDGRVEGEVVDA
jgi:hypothetical protein